MFTQPMSSQSSESPADTHSEESGDSPSVRFFLQDAVETCDVIPESPTRAFDYSHAMVNEDHPATTTPRKYNQQVFRENVFAYDAMITGWILFSPITFRVAETSDGSYEVMTPAGEENPGLVELDELGGDPVVHVNTLWNTEFPDGYTGLLTTPHIRNGDGIEVAPQHILREESVTDLTVTVRVMDEFMVSRGDAIGQLQAIPSPVPAASYRTATDEEMSAIHKERRRRSIYPDAYGKDREQTRSGELEQTE